MHKRLVYLTFAFFSSGCLFGGSSSGVDDAGSHNESDDAGDVSTDEGSGTADIGTDDDSSNGTTTQDAQTDATAMPDTGTVDVGSPVLDRSNVCVDTPPASTGASVPRRLRVRSLGEALVAAWVDSDTPRVTTKDWSTWSTANPAWSRVSPFTLPSDAQLDVATPTGLAVGSFQSAPIWLVTRRQQRECVFVESTLGGTPIGCDDVSTTWGAEITNLQIGTPHYFWLEQNGAISSMPYDDTAAAGGQIYVPWCVSDDGSTCQSLDFGAVDARANGGPYILLSDRDGRAYLWNTVQELEDPTAAEDCATAPEPPVPMILDGEHLRYADVDVVWHEGSNVLVHQTDTHVRVNRLNELLEIQTHFDELEQPGGKRPHFDAASDGIHIAAVSASGSEVSLYAFVGGEPPQHINSPTVNGVPFEIFGVGTALNGTSAAIVIAGTRGPVYAIALPMW